jgi:hypothetical protein
MPNARCPWYLSARAVTELARILGRNSDRDYDFDRTEDLLVEIVRSAKFSRNQENGLQQWSGKIPSAETPLTRDRRITLLVSIEHQNEGKLPQLVSVKRRGLTGPDRGR